jgi:DNA-binding NarL/FixJ family response regulator
LPSKIYVVEDHEELRSALIQLLDQSGELVVCGESASAEGALEALPESGANIVLVDVSLPKMNGLELIQTLKTMLPSLPCVVLTGHHSKLYIERARKVGAKGYVAKIDFSKLVPTLIKVLSKRTEFVVAGG